MNQTEDQAQQRKDLSVEAVRTLIALAALNIEHSAGEDGAEARKAFFAQLADRKTRLEFGVTVNGAEAAVTGIEHREQGSVGVVGVTLPLLSLVDGATGTVAPRMQ
jgi:hypothetical protein